VIAIVVAVAAVAAIVAVSRGSGAPSAPPQPALHLRGAGPDDDANVMRQLQRQKLQSSRKPH
jgi:hypothetical protein